MQQTGMERLRLRDFDTMRSAFHITRKPVDHDYAMHLHDCFEMEIILGGHGIMNLNGHEYELKRGCAYFINLTDFHSIRTILPLTVLTIMFSDRWVSDGILYELLNMHGDLFFRFEEKELQKMLAHTDRIMEEYHDTLPYREKCIANELECLLIRLIRQIKPDGTEDAGQDNQPVTKALLYLAIHFRENPSLSAIADYVGHNGNYFSELFHKTVGQSYIRYLTMLKLNYAKKLLLSSESSVMEICTASGYNSFSNFSRTFRDEFGISPGEFRRQNRRRKP